MPIEIKELIIRSTITEGDSNPDESNENTNVDQESIIAECVEQVMEILKEKSER